ncbi:hypothetical protein L0F63_007104 [Massospora cicadina]|nr:hypothetical protein L0F63_007104 [Massospora cicadina]
MTRSGLINMINFPIVDREEGIYRKEYRRSFMKMDEEKTMHSKKKEGYQEQLDRIIEGYAQEIRELRKKRSQSMEKPNQKTDDGQPELEEIPDVNNNNDQENTGHVYTKDSEKKKTGEREADEDLIAAKWKNQMIVSSNDKKRGEQ